MIILNSSNSNNDFNKMTFYNTAESRRVQFHIFSPENLNLIDPNKNTIPNPSVTHNPVKRKVGRPRANPAKRLFQEEIPAKSDTSVKNDGFVRCGRTSTTSSQYLDVELPPPKRNRQISAKFRCPCCNKIYLGKNKMNHHFKLFPDHKPIKPENDSLLYSHLMSLVHQKARNEEKTSFFLKELSNFVEKMQKLTPKLITTNEDNSLLENIDKNTASLLRINCGEYRLNLNVFDKNFNLENPVVDLTRTNQEEKSETHENDLDESHEDENYGFHDKEFHEESEHIESGTSNLNTSPPTVKTINQNEINNLEIPSLDCTEVNNIIRSTQELTNLTNISDIVGDKCSENSKCDLMMQQSDVFNENAICDNLVKQKLKKLPLLDLSTELFQ